MPRARPYSAVEEQALEEFHCEQFRKRVEARKQQLRERAAQPWWLRWCPWRVYVKRNYVVEVGEYIGMGRYRAVQTNKLINITITIRRIDQ